MNEKIKEKDLIFNEDGELKGSLDTLDHPNAGAFEMVKLNYEDEEGKKLVLDEIEKRMEQSAEYLASLTFTEKMRAYGHTFESLAGAYEVATNKVFEFARRLRLIEEWLDRGGESSHCVCSAMVWDQEFEGNVVPYLYCIIKEGEERVFGANDLEKGCATCEKTPCVHFYDAYHDSGTCQDYVRRTSEKYPTTPCIYANPSDADIDYALELHREEVEG